MEFNGFGEDHAFYYISPIPLFSEAALDEFLWGPLPPLGPLTPSSGSRGPEHRLWAPEVRVHSRTERPIGNQGWQDSDRCGHA